MTEKKERIYEDAIKGKTHKEIEKEIKTPCPECMSPMIFVDDGKPREECCFCGEVLYWKLK